MFNDSPNLTHSEQQAAVEKIQKMMSEGISAAQAIQMVSQEIRSQHSQQRAEQDQE